MLLLCLLVPASVILGVAGFGVFAAMRCRDGVLTALAVVTAILSAVSLVTTLTFASTANFALTAFGWLSVVVVSGGASALGFARASRFSERSDERKELQRVAMAMLGVLLVALGMMTLVTIGYFIAYRDA